MEIKSLFKNYVQKFSPNVDRATDTWHSWDATPWQHPWLTKTNLTALRDFSKELRNKLISDLDNSDIERYNFAFVGNIGNCLYTRASVLRNKGYQASMFLHPQESYIMSHPCWEEFNDSIAPEDGVNYAALFASKKMNIHAVDEVYQIPSLTFAPDFNYCSKYGLNVETYQKYISYMAHIPTVKKLRSYDALLCTQGIYLGCFSNKPYAAVSFGGDLWFEASRNDMLGKLQRHSFGKAEVILASEPLTLAHCRRYEFSNAIYIPHYLDQNKYSPGSNHMKTQWQSQYGGDFFILTSARLDNEVKGSSRALEASIKFLQKNKNARLALVGWGNHKDELIRMLSEYEIFKQVILLPISGKDLLIQYLRGADCFLGQYILGAYGHADLEAMACGVPTITYVEDNYFDYLCETGSPPIMKAQTSQQIYTHLNSLLNEENRKKISEETREWFLDNHGSEKFYMDHVGVLVALAKGKKFDFSQSPLTAKLTKEEKAYHQHGLASAPPFPNYVM